jgi:hypothetical protein
LQVAIDANGASAEENEGERADEFSDQLLEGGVHGGRILAEVVGGS